MGTVISLRGSAALRVDREQQVALLLDTAFKLMKGDVSDVSDFDEHLGALCNTAENREMAARHEWDDLTDGRLQWHDSAVTDALKAVLRRVQVNGMRAASVAVAPPLVATVPLAAE